jgi:hypothetical protein
MLDEIITFLAMVKAHKSIKRRTPLGRERLEQNADRQADESKRFVE